MSDHRYRLGCLLLGAALMTGACGEAGSPASGTPAEPTGEWRTAGCELPRPARSATVGGIDMPLTPPSLAAAIARIDSGGRGEFAGSYAGIQVDQAQVLAIVHRVASPAFDDFIRISAEDTCVVVRDATHTLAELTGWQQRISADLSAWGGRGIRISSVGARHDGAGVEIGTQDVDRARRELPEHYGHAAPLVFVEQGPVTPMAGSASGPPAAPQPGG